MIAGALPSKRTLVFLFALGVIVGSIPLAIHRWRIHGNEDLYMAELRYRCRDTRFWTERARTSATEIVPTPNEAVITGDQRRRLDSANEDRRQEAITVTLLLRSWQRRCARGALPTLSDDPSLGELGAYFGAVLDHIPPEHPSSRIEGGR